MIFLEFLIMYNKQQYTKNLEIERNENFFHI